MAITSAERQTLGLLLRSPDIGDGWRKVSDLCWPLIENFTKPELLEIERFEDKGGRVRLTEECKIVVKYLW